MTITPSLREGAWWCQEAGHRPRCVVVLCHGIGADGRQLSRVAHEWRDAVPDAVFTAPNAPFHHRRCRLPGLTWVKGEGLEWYSILDRSAAAQEAGIRTAAALLDRFIDATLQRFGLAPGDYVLGGFSQGAMTALFTGLRRAVAPRAVIAYAGDLLAPQTLAEELRNRAPVLLVHGGADRVVPPSRSRAAETVLRALDVPVETLILPALGHVIDAAGRRAGAAFVRRALSRDECREAELHSMPT
jgi:phospholipase/carboxylesterase